MKLHVAIEERTQEIMGEISTEAPIDDRKAFSNVMEQLQGRPKIVLRDGAYNDWDVRDWIRKKREQWLIPFPNNAVCNGTDVEQDTSAVTIGAFGGDKIAKSIWRT